jgi:hypothetical protein
MAEIQTILLDLGGVLVRTEWERFASLCGLTPERVRN